MGTDSNEAQIETATLRSRIASLVVASAMLGLLLLHALSPNINFPGQASYVDSGLSAAIVGLARSI